MRKTVVLILVSALLLMANIAVAGKAMDSILQKGELVVGITGSQPPLNATDKDGKIIGYEADIANLIAMNMGVKIRFAGMPLQSGYGPVQHDHDAGAQSESCFCRPLLYFRQGDFNQSSKHRRHATG